MDKHSTNWTMDGLPIEGGFDVAAAEEDLEEEDQIEEEEDLDKEGGIRRSSRTAGRKTAGGEEDYDEGWDQAWADAQHGNLPDPEDFTGIHSLDWEAGYQDYLLFGDRDESLPWDPDEDDPNWMPGFDGGTIGKTADGYGGEFCAGCGQRIEYDDEVREAVPPGRDGQAPSAYHIECFRREFGGDGRVVSVHKQAGEPHCESCGSTDYEDLNTGDQGYTACCNELVCYGGYSNKFGTPDDYEVACCWAKAEEQFAASGRPIPDGSYRLARRTASDEDDAVWWVTNGPQQGWGPPGVVVPLTYGPFPKGLADQSARTLNDAYGGSGFVVQKERPDSLDDWEENDLEREIREEGIAAWREHNSRRGSTWFNPVPGECVSCGKHVKGKKTICKKCSHNLAGIFASKTDEARSRLSSDDLKEAMVEVYDKWELANAKESPERDTLARTYLVLDDELTRRGMVLAEDDSADDQQEGLPWLEDVELETLETKE